MPCDFSKSKIYILRSPDTEDVYIGSTTRNLGTRMAEHRRDYKLVSQGKRLYKKNTAMKITKFGNAYIELIEAFPCANKNELCIKEYEVMQKYPNCVNLINPTTNKSIHVVEANENRPTV